MNQAMLAHNGELAREWAKTVYNFIETTQREAHDKNVETIFEWFVNCKIAHAECRKIIHQEYGHVDYFIIKMPTISGYFAYLRGYLRKTRVPNQFQNFIFQINDLLELSSQEFMKMAENQQLLDFINQGLCDCVSKMLASTPGQRQLKSHIADDESSIGNTISESDWSNTQQILLSSQFTERLSANLLDQFDMHSAKPKPNL